MNLLSSVLPGFREVRAPLVSGYLWLLVIWLILEGADGLPTRNDSELYAELFDLGDAIGPVGLAIVASVAAYVIGSLVQTVLRQLWKLPSSLQETRGWSLGSSSWAPAGWQSSHSYSAPLGESWKFEPDSCGFLDRTPKVMKSLMELAERGGATQVDANLFSAWKAVRDSHESPDVYIRESIRGQVTVILPGPHQNLPEPGDNEARLPMPRFSARRDILGERSVILSRLMERSPFTGSTIDRLQGESEFRFALAWPLLALIVAFAARSNELAWLGLLLIPVLLILHGIALRRHANLELVDALRARTGSDEFTDLTPVYARFCADGMELAAAMGRVTWPDLTEDELDELREADFQERYGEPDHDAARPDEIQELSDRQDRTRNAETP